jgi:hypothetical protein
MPVSNRKGRANRPGRPRPDGPDSAADGEVERLTRHKQVRVKYGKNFIQVDQGMAPLLKALWKRNIYTGLSCQENRPGIAWIMFLSAWDAEAFCDLAWNLGDEDMKGRIEQLNRRGDWEYDSVVDRIEDMGFHVCVSVRFPDENLDFLIRQLA